ncbi:unnamed protein product, partial [Iphiclides podalirius]
MCKVSDGEHFLKSFPGGINYGVTAYSVLRKAKTELWQSTSVLDGPTLFGSRPIAQHCSNHGLRPPPPALAERSRAGSGPLKSTNEAANGRRAEGIFELQDLIIPSQLFDFPFRRVINCERDAVRRPWNASLRPKNVRVL